jgi:hypothetical protein
VAITGVVKQLAGVSVLLVQVTEDDQYAYVASTDVVDLRSGKQYRVSVEDEPFGLPWSLAPGLVETVVLGADGDTARLYETPAPTGASDAPPPTTETLDVVGHGDRVLATRAPGSIDPRSIRFAGGVVTWTQDRISYRARASRHGVQNPVAAWATLPPSAIRHPPSAIGHRPSASGDGCHETGLLYATWKNPHNSAPRAVLVPRTAICPGPTGGE